MSVLELKEHGIDMR